MNFTGGCQFPVRWEPFDSTEQLDPNHEEYGHFHRETEKDRARLEAFCELLSRRGENVDVDRLKAQLSFGVDVDVHCPLDSRQKVRV